jgi:hypothetical protein
VGGLPTGTVNGLAVHPTNANVMFIAMREGVFRSDDAGARWRPAPAGVKNVAAVALNPRGSDVHQSRRRGHVGNGTLRIAATALFVVLVAPWPAARAQTDPFTAMNTLRVIPPAPAPDVAFQGLDGRAVRVETYRGRPVMLTFFTTW